MLESTPMLSRQDSAHARACQQDRPMNARMGAQKVIAAVVRAYNDAYPAAGVTPEALLGKDRTPHVAWARHLCAYLLLDDRGLTAAAAAAALGRRDHSTILNSKARIAAALPHDDRLRTLLARVRETLSGRVDDARLRARCDVARRRGLEETSPREWDEYRYWRLQALRSPRHGAMGGA